MNSDYNWHWNEFHHAGTDYNSEEEVASYDERMRKFRNIDVENQRIIEKLNLPPDASVLEIGTGTGAFARYVAGKCARVVALDISQVMLKYAARQAMAENLKNIEFRQSGFLSYQSGLSVFDGVVSGLALHHLPDMWKAVALRNISTWLKPGGRFVLTDVVFDWKDKNPEDYFPRIIETATGSQNDFARHIAQEYSTLSWVMTGLLEGTGFEIESDECSNDFLHCYTCRKKY